VAEPTYDSIIINGEPYKVEGVKVVTWLDPGGFSFEANVAAALAKTGSGLYSDRRTKKGAPVKTLDELKEAVHMVVLHTDLTYDSELCFRVLVDRGLSTHFMIDWDGPSTRAWTYCTKRTTPATRTTPAWASTSTTSCATWSASPTSPRTTRTTRASRR
jgi:hypothetical protein